MGYKCIVKPSLRQRAWDLCLDKQMLVTYINLGLGSQKFCLHVVK